MSTSLPTNGAVDTTDRRRDVLSLANRATESLYRASNLLKSTAKRTGAPSCLKCEWSLYLEKPPSEKTIETCAVSIGGLTLITCGEGTDSDAVRGAAALVTELQREDGGWTSFSRSDEEESLAIEAFCALLFLMRSGHERYRDAIQHGVAWLTETQNPDGGWGYHGGGSSQLLTTSYAVRVLAEWCELTKEPVIAQDSMLLGIGWLVKQQNEDGWWSAVPTGPASAVQTAIALLALVAPGRFRQYSEPVVRGRRWLLGNLANQEGIVNIYEVPKRDEDGNIVGFHRRISHSNFLRGIILQALIASGADLIDARLLDLVEELIDSQQPDGSWALAGAPHEKPAYAVLDACIALNQFISEVAGTEQTLQTREHMQRLDDRLEHLEGRQEAASQDIAEVNRILEQLRSDLLPLIPLSFLWRASRRYPDVVLTILVFVGFLLAYVVYRELWTSIASIVSATMVFFFAIIRMVTFYLRRRRGS